MKVKIVVAAIIIIFSTVWLADRYMNPWNLAF